MPRNLDCKHNFGFRCDAMHGAGMPAYAFVCRRLCGFFLNFDPEQAGRVREEWQFVVVAYTEENQGTKDLPPLQSSGP